MAWRRMAGAGGLPSPWKKENLGFQAKAQVSRDGKKMDDDIVGRRGGIREKAEMDDLLEAVNRAKPHQHLRHSFSGNNDDDLAKSDPSRQGQRKS